MLRSSDPSDKRMAAAAAGCGRSPKRPSPIFDGVTVKRLGETGGVAGGVIERRLSPESWRPFSSGFVSMAVAVERDAV